MKKGNVMKKTVMVLASCLLMTSCVNYGEGERIGTVIKLTKQGVLCQTWEGEMVKGGMNNGSGSFSAPLDFTIEDPSLVTEIRFAMEHQIELKVHYHEELTSFCRSDSSSLFVTSVEAMQSVGKAPEQTTLDEEAAKIQKQIDDLQAKKAELHQKERE